MKRNILDYLSSELFQDKCSKTISDDFVQGVLQFVKTNVLSYKLFIALYLNNLHETILLVINNCSAIHFPSL